MAIAEPEQPKPCPFCGMITPTLCTVTFEGAELMPVKEHKERRERIATAVLSGLAAFPSPMTSTTPAKLAVKWADALIAELDKEPSR